MGAGRPAKPTNLKVLHGTQRADRKPVNEFSPSNVRTTPPPPEYLGPEGREEWYRVADELKALQMLHKIDFGLLGAYCNEMQTYITCQKYIKDKGMVFATRDEKGQPKYIQKLPQVNIGNDALRNALQLAGQFGFTPSARTKIGTPQQQKEEDPFERLANS